MVRADLIPGARNAVRVCLNIDDRDRVAIIRDRPRLEIAEAIEGEITRFRPTASFYIGTGMKGELAFRKPMLDLLADELRCRHGHMIGIDDLLMKDGIAVDYDAVYAVTQKVFEIARHASKITVQTSLGTDLVATFSPSLKWIPSNGRYWEQGHWGNLPEG